MLKRLAELKTSQHENNRIQAQRECHNRRDIDNRMTINWFYNGMIEYIRKIDDEEDVEIHFRKKRARHLNNLGIELSDKHSTWLGIKYLL